MRKKKQKMYVHFVNVKGSDISLYREHNKIIQIYSVGNSDGWSSSLLTNIQDVINIGRGYWVNNKLIEVMYLGLSTDE